MPLKHWRRDILLITVSAVMVLLYVSLAPTGFPLDDSWIHQTYARNLGTFGEWSFIPGEVSAASTAPFYTVLLAIGYAIGIPHFLWTHALGAIALALASISAARLIETVLPDARPAPLAGGLVIALSWHLIWAAASGMETMLFSALTLLMILVTWNQVAWIKAEVQRPLTSGFVFGMLSVLLFLTRPEGILLASMAGLLLFVLTLPRIRVLLLWLAGAMIPVGVILLPYLLWNLQTTDGLLPDTASAKFVQHVPLLAMSYSQRVLNLIAAISPGGHVLLLPGLIVFLFSVTRIRPWQSALVRALLLLWPIVIILLYAARLPAAYQHGRYVIPALPALIIAGVIGMTMLLARVDSRRAGSRIGRILVRTLILSTMILIIIFALGLGVQAYRLDVRIINEEMVVATNWIRENLPADELLVIHDIGAVGYFAPRELLDIAGLVSPEVVPVLGDAQALWSLIRERGGQYLMAFADQIPSVAVDAAPQLCTEFEANGAASRSVNGPTMTVYRLEWDGDCG